jgi:hypothetical protein
MLLLCCKLFMFLLDLVYRSNVQEVVYQGEREPCGVRGGTLVVLFRSAILLLFGQVRITLVVLFRSAILLLFCSGPHYSCCFVQVRNTLVVLFRSAILFFFFDSFVSQYPCRFLPEYLSFFSFFLISFDRFSTLDVR